MYVGNLSAEMVKSEVGNRDSELSDDEKMLGYNGVDEKAIIVDQMEDYCYFLADEAWERNGANVVLQSADGTQPEYILDLTDVEEDFCYHLADQAWEQNGANVVLQSADIGNLDICALADS